MSFVRACALDEVPADEALGVVIGPQSLAIARHGDEVFAVEDICSHAAVPLSEGEVDARRLVVRGFFAELIHQIGVPDIEERLITAIERELETSMSLLSDAADAADDGAVPDPVADAAPHVESAELSLGRG